ncbi:unnamed protein product [Adineta steineri]|uniref:Uncharacterized protein n=1 Tax=Adineta steineri TaxID=433720 RepID=A0A818YAF1_9BILA|nr:unnamed protein product [Adineta steineri]CAF1128780.1 unnamed protein product [Adineta steineri]CAF3753454.1 unnamed protein product [Adineta steineri]CAF3899941.1 unnamed protein product [Adineta steineri]
MYCFFIGLLNILIVIGINSSSHKLSSSSSLIDKDAENMAELFEKIWSLKPVSVGKLEPFGYCQVIEECCTNEYRSKAISSFVAFLDNHNVKNRFIQTLNQCIKSTNFIDENNELCSSFQSSIIDHRNDLNDPDVQKFVIAIGKYQKEVERLISTIDSNCNDKEKHAIICLSNKHLLKTCVTKILQYSNHIDGDEFYQEILMKTKQIFNDIHQQLSYKFKKN